MISRTLIRIKAFKELYSRITTGSTDIKAAENELMQAFAQTQRLYGLIALLPSALAMVAEDKVATQNRKFNPDQDKIDLNTKFASNTLSSLTRADSVLQPGNQLDGFRDLPQEHLFKHDIQGLLQ